MTSHSKGVYEKFFIECYKKNMIRPHLEKLRLLEKDHPVKMDEIIKCSSLREFHDKFSVKIFGYKDS